MPVPRISPQEALGLMEREGYIYLDVRSAQEFDAGHPKDAYNVPLLLLTAQGPTPNPDFLGVMERAFPKETKIVVGCQSGGRSLQAAALLERAGFAALREQRAGFQGAPGGERGWAPEGLPIEKTGASERTWEALKKESR
jgi:rhodanese-related sulfurtransferase